MNNANSIIEKIRSLLRLAKSYNAHEANLAMQRAMEIAAKHSLDLADISPDDELNKIVGDHLEPPSRLAYEWKEALNTVHGFFNVHVTVLIGVSSKRARIVGTKLDIELASYVATFLVRSCRDCLAAFKKAEIAHRRKITVGKTHSFVRGFFWGIRNGLRSQQETVAKSNSGYHLMLDNGRSAREAAAAALSSGHGPAQTLAMPDARENRRASLRGFMEGTQTKIHHGLRANSPLALT